MRAPGVFASVLLVSAIVLHGQSSSGPYDKADIESGSHLYLAHCLGCHGPTGNMVGGIDLGRGTFTRAVTDADLAMVIETGRPDAGMPAFGTIAPRDRLRIIAFIRAGLAGGSPATQGNPARGRDVFLGNGGCGSCHRVNGRGRHLATDLSAVGAARTPASLMRSLLDPARSLIPANRRLLAVTKDGRVIGGRRLNEDTYTIQLLDDQEQLVSLDKSELRSLELLPTSAMRSYAETLTTQELADLLAYLRSLKGQ